MQDGQARQGFASSGLLSRKLLSLYRGDGGSDRIVSGNGLELFADARPVLQSGHEQRRDVGARNPPGGHVRPEPDPAGARVVGQAARPDDRPVQVTPAQIGIGGRLGPQVDLVHLLRVRIALIGAVGGDHEVAAHSGRDSGIGEQHRGSPVHSVLPGRSAARARPGGEDDGIGAADDLGDRGHIGVLQIEDGATGTASLQVGDLLGAADEADRLIPAGGERFLEQ